MKKTRFEVLIQIFINNEYVRTGRQQRHELCAYNWPQGVVSVPALSHS